MKKSQPDIKALKLLHESSVIPTKPIIAYTMHYCGCTYEQIGEVFGITRQGAERIVKNVKESIK